VALSKSLTGYTQSTTRYLQGGVVEFDMEEGMSGNVLGEGLGVRGSLMLLSMYVRAENKNFVEGDIRVWTDGSPTPVQWDSGFEDFFEGSHGYERVLHSCGEPFHTWDRAEPINWDESCWPNPCPIHFFQIRAMLADAIPFRDSWRIAIEGLGGSAKAYRAKVRAAHLVYASPAPPLTLSDWLEPGREEGSVTSPHAYTILAAPPGQMGAHAPQEYAHAASIPSFGETRPTEGLLEGVLGGEDLTIPRLFRVSPGSVISFTVALAPGARAVFLRRLVDLRVSVQTAHLWGNGVSLGQWVSSDRHFPHLGDSQWKVETIPVPLEAFQGGKDGSSASASRLNVTIQVTHDSTDSGRRVYPPFSHGPGWTEALWEVLCSG